MKLRISYKNLFNTLLSLNDSKEKIALSFAVGVFISITPSLGFHTILAIVLSFLFKLNKAATIIGTLFNNPWTTLPIYYIDYKIGAFITGCNKQFSLEPLTFEAILSQGKDIFAVLLTGSIIFGAIASFIMYHMIKYILSKHKRRIDDTAKR